MAAVAQLKEAFEQQSVAATGRLGSPLRLVSSAKVEPQTGTPAVREQTALEDYLQAVEDLNRDINSFEDRSRHANAAATALIESLEAAGAAGLPDAAEIDSAIDMFAQHEENLAKILLPTLPSDPDRGVFQLPPSVRLTSIRTTKRQKEVVHGALEFLRDARWRLMALRADIDEADDSPVFDDAEALGRHLESLP